MNAAAVDRDICLIGHPYAPIGRGEDVRLTFRALRSAGMRPGISDIYGILNRDSLQAEEFDPYVQNDFGRVNVWHINGDEVMQSMAHTASRQQPGAYNIAYPAWELSHYPEPWAEQLERFDEVWAPSRFIQESVAPAVSRPVTYMPLACEVILTSFLGRRYFGIRENTYAFLFFFDLRSYVNRKNPHAVIEAFRRLRAMRPDAEATLVIKVNGAVESPEPFEALVDSARDLGDRIVFLGRTMSDNEVKNLVRTCDCFVSLHRAEGFGRGIAEAMYLGRPVVATAYSGNLDFSNDDTALLVRHELVPVGEGEYPYPKGQVWADPDPAHAAEHMASLVDDPAFGRALGRRASVAIRKGFGLRAAGERYRARLEAIRQALDAQQAAPASASAP